MTQILVVEDDLDVLNLVAHQLRIRGYEVIPVEGPGQALRLVHSGLRPDGVVFDVMMPTMSGFKLLKELRGYEGLGNVPAVFISARTQIEDIRAGEALGATYLTKPFLSSDLADALADAMAEVGMRRPVPLPTEPIAGGVSGSPSAQGTQGTLGPTTGTAPLGRQSSDVLVGGQANAPIPTPGRRRDA